MGKVLELKEFFYLLNAVPLVVQTAVIGQPHKGLGTYAALEMYMMLYLGKLINNRIHLPFLHYYHLGCRLSDPLPCIGYW